MTSSASDDALSEPGLDGPYVEICEIPGEPLVQIWTLRPRVSALPLYADALSRRRYAGFDALVISAEHWKGAFGRAPIDGLEPRSSAFANWARLMKWAVQAVEDGEELTPVLTTVVFELTGQVDSAKLRDRLSRAAEEPEELIGHLALHFRECPGATEAVIVLVGALKRASASLDVDEGGSREDPDSA